MQSPAGAISRPPCATTKWDHIRRPPFRSDDGCPPALGSTPAARAAALTADLPASPAPRCDVVASRCSRPRTPGAPLKVPLAEWDDVVDAFASKGADHPLGDRVRLRRRPCLAFHEEVRRCATVVVPVHSPRTPSSSALWAGPDSRATLASPSFLSRRKAQTGGSLASMAGEHATRATNRTALRRPAPARRCPLGECGIERGRPLVTDERIQRGTGPPPRLGGRLGRPCAWPPGAPAAGLAASL